MVDLFRELLVAYGPFFGPLLLALVAGQGLVLHLVLRLAARFAGLLYLMVDEGMVTNEKLIKYGALDDPRTSGKIKGVLTS